LRACCSPTRSTALVAARPCATLINHHGACACSRHSPVLPPAPTTRILCIVSPPAIGRRVLRHCRYSCEHDLLPQVYAYVLTIYCSGLVSVSCVRSRFETCDSREKEEEIDEDKGERETDRQGHGILLFILATGSGVLVVYVMGLGPGLSAMRLALAGRGQRQGAPTQLQTSVLIGCSVLYVYKPTPRPNTETLKPENRNRKSKTKKNKSSVRFGSRFLVKLCPV
jgi:hypothetical protein